MTSVAVIVPIVSVYHHVVNTKGRSRFRCRDTHKVFLLTCTYEARKLRVEEQISETAFNDANVSDTGKTVEIA